MGRHPSRVAHHRGLESTPMPCWRSSTEAGLSSSAMANLPQGTVTFLFTDIEGSTRLAERVGAAYSRLLEQHQSLVRAAIAEGVEISTAGDSFFVAFDSAVAAVEAAVGVQRA